MDIHIDYSETQLPDDELIAHLERKKREALRDAAARKKLIEKRNSFHWCGGIC